MAVTQINELAVTGTSAGSAWFVMDKEVSPGVYQTQKIAGENIGGNLFSQALTLGANREHDMNGFGLKFLKSNFEFRATDGLSSGRPFGIRNHTNDGWLTEFRNDGQNYYSNNQFLKNGNTILFGSELGLTNQIFNSFGSFFFRGDRQIVLQGSGGTNVMYTQLDSSNTYYRCNNSELPDGGFANSFIGTWIDEGTNTLNFKIRKSDGSFVTKTL